jgi:probable F420-dependent oxidoreductase
MAHARRFRFACELHEPLPGLNWLDSFREVEQLGYSTLFLPDHLHEGPGPLAAMAAAAAVTTELIVGPLVFDCDFRHPAILARELATIDQLAEGRLEVGLGAGWRRLDYDQAGIPMDRPGVRVSRMIEHATVLRGLWTEGESSFAGDHYTIDALDGSPAPFTPGGPPILIGGGAPRVLRFAGSTADIVGVNASIHSGEIDTEAARDGQADRIDRKVEWVREGAGDRFDELELNAWLALAHITDDAQGFAEAVAPGFGGTPDEVLESPLTLIGTEGEIAERLEARRARWGYSYHVVPGDQAHEFAAVVASLSGR